MRRRGLLLAVALAVILPAAGWLALAGAERAGREFFLSGRDAVEALARMAAAIRERDGAALAACLDPDYRGALLGLGDPLPERSRDGVVESRFSPGGAADAPAAAREWLDYREGFAELEDLDLHLHRLHAWRDGAVEATARFEAVGTRRGAARPSVDRAYLRVRLARGRGGMRLQSTSLVEGGRVEASAPLFREVGGAAGVAFENRSYPAFLGEPLRFGMIRHGPGGISAADYDGDGLHDLFVPDGVEARLLRNRGDGTFADVTAAAGLAGQDGVSVGVFADYDNDGHRDLFVSRTFTANRLFHARGDGSFADVTAASGLGEDCCTTAASWADVDLDGDLDLYVCRYLDPRRDIPTSFYARNGEPNRLYRNEGGGRFRDVTAEAGVGDTGLCLATVFGDYDDDGDPDLYVVNDFGRNTLYRNDGGGAFRDVTVEAGALAYGAGMSATMVDYDNDGRLDLYTTDIRSEHSWFAEAPTVRRYLANSIRQGAWPSDAPLYLEIFRQSGSDFVGVFQEMAMGNHLLRNRGDGAFADVSWTAGANPVGWYWGAVVADLDNDGWQDVYAADGWVYGERGTEIELEFLEGVVGRRDVYKSGRYFDPAHFGGRSWHGWERNRHLRNDRDGTFTEIATPAGTGLLRNSRGVAAADFWNRGVLDLAVAASADRHALLRNQDAGGRSWVGLELVGTRSNRDAVGARVEARAGGLRQLREVTAGDGYASQGMLRVHFGLGEAERVEELRVRWPSGLVERFADVAGRRVYELAEGSGRLVERRLPRVEEPER